MTSSHKIYSIHVHTKQNVSPRDIHWFFMYIWTLLFSFIPTSRIIFMGTKIHMLSHVSRDIKFTQILTCVFTFIYSIYLLNICAYICINIHTHKHIYVHKYIYIHRYIHTYIHTEYCPFLECCFKYLSVTR